MFIHIALIPNLKPLLSEQPAHIHINIYKCGDKI